MPLNTQQPLSEQTLLNRYLLLPSSLPTILPYNAFLAQLPTAARNNAKLQPHLRRLYADLQSQRNLDLDTVRANITRECARAGTVKAQLRRDLARELGDGYDETNNAEVKGDADMYYIDMKRESSVELAPSRKRKRGAPAAADADDEEGSNDEEEDSASSPSPSAESPASAEADDDNDDDDDDEIPESPHSTTPTPSHSHQPSEPPAPPNLHPSKPPPPTATANSHLDALLDASFHGPRGLAIPHHNTFPNTTYHSAASLLRAMESAAASLQREIADLEKEAAAVMAGMRETVGGLSDLRYGSFGGRGAAGGGAERGGMEGGVGVGEEVRVGLRTLREVAERKVREL